MRLNLGVSRIFGWPFSPAKLTEKYQQQKRKFQIFGVPRFWDVPVFFSPWPFLVWLFLVNLRIVSAWARQNRNILVDPDLFCYPTNPVCSNKCVCWNILSLQILLKPIGPISLKNAVPSMCHHHCWCWKELGRLKKRFVASWGPLEASVLFHRDYPTTPSYPF